MDDISTSYCFICLLHLANEKGLTIDPPPNTLAVTYWTWTRWTRTGRWYKGEAPYDMVANRSIYI